MNKNKDDDDNSGKGEGRQLCYLNDWSAATVLKGRTMDDAENSGVTQWEI